MKKFISVFAFLFCVCTVSFAVSGEDITKYHLKEFNTVEEFKEAYLNKIITYAPVEKYISLLGRSSLSQQMNLDFRFRNFLVTSITGKTKKNKDTQDMEWTIKEVDGYVTKTFKVHTGNYTKKISYYSSDSEFLFKDLQFFALGAWKEDHKSEIGKVFENPMVKAKYEVTDVSLSIEEDKDDYKPKILKYYTVKNIISGKESKYVAAK